MFCLDSDIKVACAKIIIMINNKDRLVLFTGVDQP